MPETDPLCVFIAFIILHLFKSCIEPSLPKMQLLLICRHLQASYFSIKNP